MANAKKRGQEQEIPQSDDGDLGGQRKNDEEIGEPIQLDDEPDGGGKQARRGQQQDDVPAK